MAKSEKPDKPTGNKIALVAVVNGQPVNVEGNVNAPLQTIIPEALEKSGNKGQPPENWLVKDEQGNELDRLKKIGDFNFAPGTKIFLSLRAGVTGVSAN
jgi:hypothetical protein